MRSGRRIDRIAQLMRCWAVRECSPDGCNARTQMLARARGSPSGTPVVPEHARSICRDQCRPVVIRRTGSRRPACALAAPAARPTMLASAMVAKGRSSPGALKSVRDLEDAALALDLFHVRRVASATSSPKVTMRGICAISSWRSVRRPSSPGLPEAVPASSAAEADRFRECT